MFMIVFCKYGVGCFQDYVWYVIVFLFFVGIYVYIICDNIVNIVVVIVMYFCSGKIREYFYV